MCNQDDTTQSKEHEFWIQDPNLTSNTSSCMALGKPRHLGKKWNGHKDTYTCHVQFWRHSDERMCMMSLFTVFSIEQVSTIVSHVALTQICLGSLPVYQPVICISLKSPESLHMDGHGWMYGKVMCELKGQHLDR